MINATEHKWVCQQNGGRTTPEAIISLKVKLNASSIGGQILPPEKEDTMNSHAAIGCFGLLFCSEKDDQNGDYRLCRRMNHMIDKLNASVPYLSCQSGHKICSHKE